MNFLHSCNRLPRMASLSTFPKSFSEMLRGGMYVNGKALLSAFLRNMKSSTVLSTVSGKTSLLSSIHSSRVPPMPKKKPPLFLVKCLVKVMTTSL